MKISGNDVINFLQFDEYPTDIDIHGDLDEEISFDRIRRHYFKNVAEALQTKLVGESEYTEDAVMNQISTDRADKALIYIAQQIGREPKDLLAQTAREDLVAKLKCELHTFFLRQRNKDGHQNSADDITFP